MQRRLFVKAAAVGAGATALAACGQNPSGGGAPAVHTQERVSWQLFSSYPRATDLLYAPLERLAERVSALTDGRFRIRAYPAGEMVPPLEVLGAVQRGTAQMGHSASYYYKGLNPAFIFDTTVPFGLTARQQTAWLLYGGGMELLRELFASVDIVNLPGGNTGAQMGGWFRRPVGGLTDLRGLSMRIPGMGGEVMSRLGVNAQALPGSEVYTALERGAIDAAEWVGPYDDEKLGLNALARYYYAPGWWEPGPALSFYVNRAAWERLPAFYQRVLEAVAHDESQRMLAAYDARNPEALARLVDGGTEVRRFSDEILTAARDATTDLLESTASASADFRRIYEPWKRFREDSHRWFSVSERSFIDFALPPVPSV